jgi:tRNA-specific 2-thiouridylase
MDAERLEHHLLSPQGRERLPRGGALGVAAGGGCGDVARIGVAIEDDRVAEAGFEASGCATMGAAGSAAVALARGRPALEVARVGAPEIAAELGGLSPGKLHAAELTADALARALGSALAGTGALPSRPERVLVAMSGGVDSSVAALLCATPSNEEPQAEVVGVTLELWRDADNDPERSCCSASAVRSARALAHRMGLPHLTLDLRDEFRAGVVQPFLDGHAAGETPNPCVLCNGNVRLDAMLELAARLGAGALATGHYARVHHDGDGPLLRVAADPAKDQSYMLAGLAPASLARLRFPLGELTKPEVRELAAQAQLPVARAPESQDLCFLAGTGKAAFLARHGGLRDRPGEVVDRAGHVVGRHRGHHHFTVGQRRGLGVGGGAPLYVLETDARANHVVVGPREALRRRQVRVRDVLLHRDGARVDRAKLRYRSRPLPARIADSPPAGAHDRLRIELAEPALGAAPGQVAVLMDGDLVLGAATIA